MCVWVFFGMYKLRSQERSSLCILNISCICSHVSLKHSVNDDIVGVCMPANQKRPLTWLGSKFFCWVAFGMSDTVEKTG